MQLRIRRAVGHAKLMPGVLFCLLIVSGCGEDKRTNPRTERDQTRDRLIYLSLKADEYQRNHNYPGTEVMLSDPEFFELLADYFVDPDDPSIVDIWGHDIRFELVNPDNRPRSVQCLSPGENGIWGDEDDMRFPPT